MTDYSSLFAHVDSSLEEIKAALPITFVLEQYGLDVTLDGDGRAHTLCPWHQDSEPSLDVFGENFERAGCFPCGFTGDVFDVLQKLDPAITSVGQAVARARELLPQLSGWAGPRHGNSKPAFDLEAARELVWGSQVESLDAVINFATAKELPLDPEWLADRWRLGARGESVVIPYYDRSGQIVAYKTRTADTKPRSAAGTKFDLFYGEWLDADPSLPVILCEGESDTWTADAHLYGRYAALGLPTGTQTPTLLAARLKGRHVTLAFDGDDAGRRAARIWNRALHAEGCFVRILRLPDGADISTAGPLGPLVDAAQPAPVAIEQLTVQSTGYARLGAKDTLTQVSSWVFEPTKELVGAEGLAYKGQLLPRGVEAVITSHDLKGKGQVTEWANRHGGSWLGSDRDAQTLLGMFQAEGAFLAQGKMTFVAGMNDGCFVYPGGSIGHEDWTYVDGKAALTGKVRIAPGEWSLDGLRALFTLHQPDVMDPILAWLAVAPIRSLLREFPVLSVTGSSGSGKTTLVETLLRAFAGSLVDSNLTGTTPYAIEALASASSGVPIWFDEYRPGANTKALVTMDQVIRDAYTSQSSLRGGHQDNWQKLVETPITAPIIVSGEDAFSETSHVDRMVLVSMPMEGRNPSALAAARQTGMEGFAYAYISWLVAGLREDRIGAAVTNYEYGPETLKPRQRLNLGVLHLGWMLLRQFLAEHGATLRDPDFSLFLAEVAEASASSPIEDALVELNGTDAVIRRGENFLVRPHILVKEAQNRGIKLPGGSKAIKKYLQQKYGATESTTTIFDGGAQVRVLKVPAADQILNGPEE